MYSFGKSLARKSPAPDAMEALGGGSEEDEETEAPDEDASEATAASAFNDFAKAAGFTPSPKAYAFFKEAVSACMKG